MNKTVLTVVPIPVEHIKAYFADKELSFLLDYKNSKIKNKPFLTYMGNNGIPSDVVIDGEVTEEERFSLMKDFMSVRVIVEAPTLVETLACIMIEATGLDATRRYTKSILNREQIARFIKENQELVDQWYTFLLSCMLYLIYTVEDLNAVVDVKANHKHIDDANYIGLNVVTLFALPEFYEQFFAGTLPTDPVYFFTQQFEEPMFKGSKLLKYFNVEQNPFYNVLLGLISGALPITPPALLEFKVNDTKDVKDE